jgi:restriction system protein
VSKRTYTQLEPVNILLAICLVAAITVYQQTEAWTQAGLAFLLPFLLYLVYLEIRRILRRKALLESGIEEIDRMSGEAFEEVLLVHFQHLGYRGTLTPESGDYGADLVLEKGMERIVVQAKRYKNVVGIEAVQQVIGALKYYQANKGMVVTNSVYTPNAIALAHANGIDLIDREQLIGLLRKSQGQERIKQLVGASTEPASRADEEGGILPDEQCPVCGRVLVARTGKYGAFIGCSGYPRCHFTRQ